MPENREDFAVPMDVAWRQCDEERRELLIANDGLAAKVAQYEAAFQLAADDQIMFFRRGEQVFPAILVNDTFYYACADAETVDWSVMPELLDEYRTQGWPVVVERVATMRNLRPLPDVERAMEKARDAQQRVESERDALAAPAHKLAMAVLQSDFYRKRPGIKAMVDDVLAVVLPTAITPPPTGSEA